MVNRVVGSGRELYEKGRVKAEAQARHGSMCLSICAWRLKQNDLLKLTLPRQHREVPRDSTEAVTSSDSSFLLSDREGAWLLDPELFVLQMGKRVLHSSFHMYP